MIKKGIASILIILIFINSMGCMSYKSIRTADKNEIEKAKKVRLTTVENKEYTLTEVKVEGLKISGKYGNERIEFSTRQIYKIEVGEVNTVSTILLVIGISALVYGLVKAMEAANQARNVDLNLL